MQSKYRNATIEGRNIYIDIVRGIAIILVVVGHCIQYGSGSEYLNSGAFFSNPFFKFIYSFHMPLFMLISGYLCRNSITKKSIRTFITDKFRGLLIPLIAWHTLFQIIMLISGTKISLEVFGLSYFHTLWFLRALFASNILVLLINKFGNDYLAFYIGIICLLPFIPTRLLPDVFSFTIPYFIIGYLYAKYHKKMHNTKRIIMSYPFYFLTFLLFVCLLLFYEDNYYVYISKTYLFNPNYSLMFMVFVNSYRNITAVLGCFFCLISINFAIDYIPKSIIHSILVPIGKTSLCIYIVNHYLNELLLLRLPVSGINLFYIFGETILIVCIGYGCALILKKDKFSNLLLLGGR